MKKNKLTVADLKTVFGGCQSPDTGTPPPPPPSSGCSFYSLIKVAQKN